MNVRWHVPLGTQSHSTPIVAGGRVYIGTNNANPRDPKHQGDRGIFLCLDEKNGHMLWQLVVPKLDEDKYYDWPDTGMASPATVEGDHVYTFTNRYEVVCLDAKGMSNGNDGPFQDELAHMTPHDQTTVEPSSTDADIVWLCDLRKEAGIWPHDGAHSSILVLGDYLYVNTCTGVDNTHRVIRTPDAPCLVVIDKRTGRLLARDHERITPDVFHSNWSSPAVAEINGRKVVCFCGGNGMVYFFEPIKETPPPGQVLTLHKLGQFDFDPEAPKKDIHGYLQNKLEGPSNIYGMPVYAEGKWYIAGGGDVFWGKGHAWLKCLSWAPHDGKDDSLDITCLWTHPLNKHTLSTAAVQDGLVYVTDAGNTLHCLDAKTGATVWTHEMNGSFWASPLVADGKVYVGTRKGNFCILAAEREKKVLCNVDFRSPISATTTAANGVVYIATMKELYAIAKPAAKQ